MEINIDPNTEQTIREALNQRIARTMRNVMPDIGEVILTSIEDRFDAQSAKHRCSRLTHLPERGRSYNQAPCTAKKVVRY